MQRKGAKLIFVLVLFAVCKAFGEDGYRLWLRYDKIQDKALLKQYQSLIKNVYVGVNSETGEIIKSELKTALKGLLDKDVPFVDKAGTGTLTFSLSNNGAPESYSIKNTAITAKDDAGLLYGMFHFLRLLQTNQDITKASITSAPKIKTRLLNHWDNLDRTVERGYAGFSIWDWHRLPQYVDPRYSDYARANASIGINSVVLTNVNANARLITPFYLEKVKVLADLFRPYNIKIFLTARFSAPIEIGGLKTADPLDPEVRKWWKTKVDEIYEYIPDFGGFLVKANSEGQPGPQNYARSHADGANMLAEAVAPHNGIVMWRAFVYDNNVPEDRAKQAYSEFKPLDGKFNNNVIIQVKNGPIDFQPREPFHPLFGAMTLTPLMMEFQITQEYLGQASHIAFLPIMWKETLSQIDLGKSNALKAIAGVANIGNDRNWTGHLFGQSNWYGYGRMAWDPDISPSTIANEWARMTFSNDREVVGKVVSMMDSSHTALVNYMTPLGLHHIMGPDHHYGPGPWVSKMPRADWTSVYYHKADSLGIGFDRTKTGSNSLEQYPADYQKLWGDPKTCPDELLLWFHHLPWDYKMKSGLTLWEELCRHYEDGLGQLSIMRAAWHDVEGKVDADRYKHVEMLLDRQEYEANLWHNSCILYFQKISKRPVPAGINTGDKTLEYYMGLQYPYAPGIRPRW